MENNIVPEGVHPSGELESGIKSGESPAVFVDTFGGRVHVEWDIGAAVTPFGSLAFFVDFLEDGGPVCAVGGGVSAGLHQ